jgi:hypothetical protein
MAIASLQLPLTGADMSDGDPVLSVRRIGSPGVGQVFAIDARKASTRRRCVGIDGHREELR